MPIYNQRTLFSKYCHDNLPSLPFLRADFRPASHSRLTREGDFDHSTILLFFSLTKKKNLLLITREIVIDSVSISISPQTRNSSTVLVGTPLHGKNSSTHVVMLAKEIDVLLTDGVVEIMEALHRRKPAGLSHLRIRGQAVVPAPVYDRSDAITVEV